MAYIGPSVEVGDPTLLAYSDTLSAADKLAYASATDVAAEINFDAAARLLLTDMKFSGMFGEKVVALGTLTGTINTSTGTYFTGTLTGAINFATGGGFTNPVASGHCSGFMLEITNGGAFAITWPTSLKWPAGVAPALTAAGVDVLAFMTINGGTTWRGTLVQKDSK